MSNENTTGYVVRIIPIFYVLSIFVFVFVGEYLSSAATEVALPDSIFADGDFQVFHIVLSVLSALMVAFAIAMKRAILGGSFDGMRRVVKTLMRNTRSRGRGSGNEVIIVPLSLSEGVAVIGFALFVIGGGQRLLCYPFYGLALISMIVVLPNRRYAEKAAALAEEVRKELNE